MSINGLIRPDSNFLSWATRTKLKRPLDVGASSTSILDSGLDLAVDGSVVVFSFSLPLATACCLLCSRSNSDFIWSQFATLSYSLCSCSRSALSRCRSRIALSRSRIAWSLSSLAWSLSRIAWSLSRLALSRSLWARSDSLFRLLRSGYDSYVCCDRFVDDVLPVDWVHVPASGLVARGNSPAPYFVVLLKPGFLARSNPLTPPSTFQDSQLVCS